MKDQTTRRGDSGKGHYFLRMNGSVPMEGVFVSSRLYKYQTGEIAPLFGTHIGSTLILSKICKFVDVNNLTKLHVVSMFHR